MAKTAGNPSENIQHIVSVKYRVTGSGNFKTTVLSYDGVKSSALADITLQATTDREPVTLANFLSMRMQIRFETTEFDEIFTLDKIVPFIKPSSTSYPQGI